MNLTRLFCVFTYLFYGQARAMRKNFADNLCRKFQTRALRKSCQRSIGSTQRLLLGASMDIVEDPFSLTIGPPGAMLDDSSTNNGVGVSLDCRIHTRCPVNGSIAANRKDNIRNTSPWDYCPHYDSNRFPQYLSQAVCLCQGCIDPATGTHKHGLISRPITTKISVIKKPSTLRSFAECNDSTCAEQEINVDVGCYCSIPLLS